MSRHQRRARRPPGARGLTAVGLAAGLVLLVAGVGVGAELISGRFSTNAGPASVEVVTDGTSDGAPGTAAAGSSTGTSQPASSPSPTASTGVPTTDADTRPGARSATAARSTSTSARPSQKPARAAATRNSPAASDRESVGSNPYAAYSSDQCTYYAEEKMHEETGLWMPLFGDAWRWADGARRAGWTVTSTPVVRSVAVFPKGAFGSSVGHVAWVEAVSGGRVRITDFNWNGRGARVTDHWVDIPDGSRFIRSDR